MIVKKKLFFAWNMKNEKKWLEEQGKLGYVLKDIKLFRYYFEKTDPQDLVYEFDFQILTKEKQQDYLELFEEWTLVGRLGGWYYFRKPRSTKGPNVIYSNNETKKALYRRLIGFLALVGFPIYYQIIIIFPNMDPAELEFPKFYFFFRIIAIAFMIVHLYALLRIFYMKAQYRKNIKE